MLAVEFIIGILYYICVEKKRGKENYQGIIVVYSE